MALALVSFAAMGIIHKLGDRTHAQPMGIALFTMLTAGLASLVLATVSGTAALRSTPPTAILIALPFGASAAAALWIFQKGLRFGHIATSWLIINLSAGIPTVLSILVYREPINLKKLGVLLLVLMSLLLLWWDRREQTGETK
jgi:EamA domain-containing membrane protein RarD